VKLRSIVANRFWSIPLGGLAAVTQSFHYNRPNHHTSTFEIVYSITIAAPANLSTLPVQEVLFMLVLRGIQSHIDHTTRF
jgi:hypothetical protein